MIKYRKLKYSDKDTHYYSKIGVLTRIFIHEFYKDRVEYTKEEFIKRWVKDSIFNKLYDDWVKSGYKRQFIPKIRKINLSLCYSFDNIQIINNMEKPNEMDRI